LLQFDFHGPRHSRHARTWPTTDLNLVRREKLLTATINGLSVDLTWLVDFGLGVHVLFCEIFGDNTPFYSSFYLSALCVWFFLSSADLIFSVVLGSTISV
jgi:hypothetical protein